MSRVASTKIVRARLSVLARAPALATIAFFDAVLPSVRALLPTFRTSRDEFLPITGTTQSMRRSCLTSFAPKSGVLIEPPIHSHERTNGPLVSRTRQLSIDTLFHARYATTVSRAFTQG